MQVKLLLVGRRIRAIRESKGLSQEKLADKAGMAHNYMGKIERGETNPSLKILFSVADGLGLSISDLLDVDVRKDEEIVGNISARLKNLQSDKLKLVNRCLFDFNLVTSADGKSEN